MKNKYFSQYFFLIVVFAIVFFFLPSRALALSIGGISIGPADNGGHRDWFIYSLKPGESIEDYVVVSNGSDKEETVAVRAYDSEPSNVGAFSLTGPNKAQKGVGLWVKLDETDVLLAPGEKKKIRFTFTIPNDADAGEHSGAITVQTQPKELKGVTGISFGTRIGARIYETVPGAIVKKMRIISFSLQDLKDRGEFELDLTGENLGNVSLSPFARLDIGGWGLISKKEVFHSTSFQNYWQLLRGATVSTNWIWPKPYFGKFAFQVTLTYEDENGNPQKLTTNELYAWIIPTKDMIILGSVLFIILLIIITWLVYKKKKYSGKGWDSYTVKESDNIMVLAQKCGVTWRFLAKVNRIKKPYFLVPGKDILVPPGTLKDKSSKDKKSSGKDAKKGKRDVLNWVFLMMIVILTTAVLIFAAIIFVGSMKKSEDVAIQPVATPTILPEDIVFGNKPGAVPEEPKSATSTPTTTPADINEPSEETETAPATTTPSTAVPGEGATTTEQISPPAPKTAKVRVSVLNGSGIAGYAGKLSKVLSDNGYDATAGNAESFEHTNLNIIYLDPFKDEAENIQKILLEEYKNIVVTKAEKQEFDIVVILGKK